LAKECGKKLAVQCFAGFYATIKIPTNTGKSASGAQIILINPCFIALFSLNNLPHPLSFGDPSSGCRQAQMLLRWLHCKNISQIDYFSSDEMDAELYQKNGMGNSPTATADAKKNAVGWMGGAIEAQPSD